MSLGSAEIDNNGYYDVPICDQYSNTEVRDSPINVTDKRLNENINLIINDNRMQYIVEQPPFRPNTDLFVENNEYNNNSNEIIPLKNNSVVDDKIPEYDYVVYSKNKPNIKNINRKEKIEIKKIAILILVFLLVGLILYYFR